MKRLLLLLSLAVSLSAQPSFDDTYERFLLPVFVPATPGAFGSEFNTLLTVWPKSQTETVRIFGLEQWCGVNVICPEPDPNVPVEVHPYGQGPSLEPPVIIPNGIPGRFIYVPDTEADLVAMNLRALDQSRSNLNYGTQMPIPRRRDFTRGPVVLPDVPMSSRFRKTLRVYSTHATAAMISFEGPEIIGSPVQIPPPPQYVDLRAGMNVFDPAYAELSALPLYPRNLNVVVQALECICSPPVPAPPIWAFITVTNNETQHITTVSPN